MEEKSNNSNQFKEFYNRHKSKFNFLYMVVICLVIAKLITSFVFISVKVDGRSMCSTLQDGDKAITDGLFYKMTGIDRFDIVVIKVKGYDDKLVKRVIGLPGETVEYVDSVLYINGEIVEEPFLDEGVETTMKYNRDFKRVLEDDEYFVLGDNRENSSDSRIFGPIKKSQIKGVGMLRFSSCSKYNEKGLCAGGFKLKWPKTVK